MDDKDFNSSLLILHSGALLWHLQWGQWLGWESFFPQIVDSNLSIQFSEKKSHVYENKLKFLNEAT
jgi:hypothetical protein